MVALLYKQIDHAKLRGSISSIDLIANSLSGQGNITDDGQATMVNTKLTSDT
jgi:hypothetical protein